MASWLLSRGFFLPFDITHSLPLATSISREMLNGAMDFASIYLLLIQTIATSLNGKFGNEGKKVCRESM